MAENENPASGTSTPEKKTATPVTPGVAQGLPPEVLQGLLEFGNKHLAISQETERNSHKLKSQQQEIGWRQSQSDRRFEVFALILFSSMIAFVIIMFRDKPEALHLTLTGLGALFAGLMAGIGYGRKKSNDKSE